ncbi:Putative ribonuclease H protein At1g65750 [Linum perenne]
MNSALLSKWSWRFGVERSVWKWIVQESNCFWDFGHIDPGGGWVSFWFDFWVRGVELCEAFPRIAAIARSLDSFVCECVVLDDRLHWDIPLRGTLRGGAERERIALLERLESLPPSLISEGPATLVWPLEKNGVFPVRSLARELIGRKFRGMEAFPAEMVWVRHAPTKVGGFVWQVAHGKISTIDNLISRGFMIPNRCVMCGASSESIIHLFRECTFAHQVWIYFSSRLSVFGPFPLLIKEWLWAWKGLNYGSVFSPCVKVLLHGFLWDIWGERSNRVFQDVTSNPKVVAFRIAVLVGQWCVAGRVLDRSTLGVWLGLFRFVEPPN